MSPASARPDFIDAARSPIASRYPETDLGFVAAV